MTYTKQFLPISLKAERPFVFLNNQDISIDLRVLSDILRMVGGESLFIGCFGVFGHLPHIFTMFERGDFF
jgi:hypothetical protein